jgi:hypothetical protein
MSDFAEADSASEYFGEHKRIERQQQLFVFAEFVGVHKTDGDELGGLAAAFRRNTLNRMDTRFEILGCRNNVESQPPLGCLEAFLGGCDGALVLRPFGSQAFDCGVAVRFILALHPFGISIGGRWFAGESEPAFGRAFYIVSGRKLPLEALSLGNCDDLFE